MEHRGREETGIRRREKGGNVRRKNKDREQWDTHNWIKYGEAE